ncbi:MFS transporter [Brevibacillus migulae]|uniref:MFS transporter n=1 Tax=Brevibacillus migulae TaxID=1644114 RepID=UPI00106E1E12|nr:MFS transporter [Brevibacillus migulae]
MSNEASPRSGLLDNRVIRTILLSGVFLQMGIWVRNFAVLFFVMGQTNNDPYAVSLISVAQFGPIFLFSFIGGTFADRWPPRRTMIGSDLLSALSICLVLLALVFGTWKVVFFATLISSILSQFSQPAALKLFKVHVPEEQLQAVVAMNQTLMAIFMILGPALGTFIYQTFGIYTSIGVMAVTFLLSALVLFQLPRDEASAMKRTDSHFWSEFADGFRYVWVKPILRRLGMVFMLVGLASGLTSQLLIFLIVDQLGLPNDSFQWALVSYGVAMLVGGGLVMKLPKTITPQALVAMGLLASAIGSCGNGLSTALWTVLIFQFLNGLFFPFIHAGFSMMILRNSEQVIVGRVNGVLTPMFMGMMVLSMGSVGWLKNTLPIPVVYGSAAVMFVIGMLLLVPVLKQTTAATQSS